jgi:hypothetical protein
VDGDAPMLEEEEPEDVIIGDLDAPAEPRNLPTIPPQVHVRAANTDVNEWVGRLAETKLHRDKASARIIQLHTQYLDKNTEWELSW